MLPLLRVIAALSVLAAPAVAQGLAPTVAGPVPSGDTGIVLDSSLRPKARTVTPIPDARWDHVRGSTRWSQAALAALSSHASGLPKRVPRDIQRWCPAYASGTEAQRKAFWVGLVSALAKHESTYRPQAVGGGGRWYGLLQILPSTARLYGCRARSGDALKDGSANLSCGLRIMARTVARDGVISEGMRGVAADWGPFHSRKKRQDMMAWTRSQSYCTAIGRSLRPVARPERTVPDPAAPEPGVRS